MSDKLKILCVFGTRPEVIKMAPVIQEMKKNPEKFICKICVTGQHREMIDPLLELFEITADYDLNLMQENQGLEHITITVLSEIGKIIDKEHFDYLMVQGDTTTAMAASLAAFYKRVKVAHVEAGLRTWDNDHPYPEEVNRKIIDGVSDLFFAHSDTAKQNLLNEGIEAEKIEVTGNTVIDVLLESAKKEYDFRGSVFEKVFNSDRKMILVTAHRRENFGQPIENICHAIKNIADRLDQEIMFVYPVHLNPNIQKPVYSLLGGSENILLTEPQEYLPFVHLMKRAYFILTDSGGLQEEAPSLGKPVLVLRQTTERPEGVESGCVEIVGTDIDHMQKSISELLDNKTKYERMAQAVNPYGDGKASQRIIARLFKEEA